MLGGRSFARLALPVIWGASVLPAAAHPVYDTERIFQYQRQECVGAAGHPCSTVHSRLTRVGARESEQITLTCPRAYPHVVGWDAKRHEHLELTALPSGGGLHSLTVVAQNRANAAGSFRFYIGCATKPFSGSGGFMQKMHASPSRPVQPQGSR
ncbi:hypothetical protein [Geminicoccus roseus]|uniref:hypothetical protein n=1 Tax=Geminicoccus roseus TaxID=404900 RepID=UPI0003FDADAD|nr:hypothetical protein [Geminicoccus roseus]